MRKQCVLEKLSRCSRFFWYWIDKKNRKRQLSRTYLHMSHLKTLLKI